MSNEKLSQLPSVLTVGLSDLIYDVQGGVSSQATIQQVFNLMLSNTILNFAGNPNSHVAGSIYQLCWDTSDNVLWVCTTTGSTSTAVWKPCIGQLTNGQLLIGSTGASPVATNITAGTGISVTNGAGSISIGIAANAGAGLVVQVIQGQLTTPTSILSSTPVSTGVTATITPTASTSKILVRASLQVCVNASDNGFLQIVRGATPIGIGTTAGSRTSAGASPGNPATQGQMETSVLEWLDSPATTSSTTYTVQMWTSGGNQSYVNQSVTDTNSAAFARTVSTITLMEVK